MCLQPKIFVCSSLIRARLVAADPSSLVAPLDSPLSVLSHLRLLSFSSRQDLLRYGLLVLSGDDDDGPVVGSRLPSPSMKISQASRPESILQRISLCCIAIRFFSFYRM